MGINQLCTKSVSIHSCREVRVGNSVRNKTELMSSVVFIRAVWGRWSLSPWRSPGSGQELEGMLDTSC